MFVAMRAFRPNPGAADEVRQRVQSDLDARVRRIAGFVSHQLTDGENGTLISLCVFEDQAGADEYSRVVADWTDQHLSELIQRSTEAASG